MAALFSRIIPILFVGDLQAERDFYVSLGFHVTYEGPEYPYFLALGQESNLFGNLSYEGNNYGIKDPTESDVRRVIDSIVDGEQDLAILIKDGDEDMYVQTAEAGKGRLLLEYQDGSPDKHYGAISRDLTAEQVISAFLEYMRGESGWKSRFVWEKMNF